MLGVAVLVLIAPALAQAAPDMYCGERNVQAVDGTVRLARQWDVVFEEGFDDGLDAWRIENYEQKLSIRLDESGVTGNCVLVTNEGAEGDTAFEAGSTSRGARIARWSTSQVTRAAT